MGCDVWWVPSLTGKIAFMFSTLKTVAAVLPKAWYLPTALHSITFQITVTAIFMMVVAINPIIHNSGQPEHIAEKKYFVYMNVRWEFFLNLLSKRGAGALALWLYTKLNMFCTCIVLRIQVCDEGAMLHVESSYVWIHMVFVMCASQNLLGFSVAVMLVNVFIWTLSGRDCEHDIDECSHSSELCNNGICVNSLGMYYSDMQRNILLRCKYCSLLNSAWP